MPKTRPFRLMPAAMLIALAVVLVYEVHTRSASPPIADCAGLQAASESYFSPETNLEQLDIGRIEEAKKTIDVGMYAFTDKYIAEALLAAAHSGVAVRIYRDRQQFEDEQRNSGAHAMSSTTEMFKGEENIRVRVKRSRELMHLKAYLVDGRLLRDGSANWSPTGLKRQDNNARFTTDASQVKAFRQMFEDMWRRDDNTEIQ